MRISEGATSILYSGVVRSEKPSNRLILQEIELLTSPLLAVMLRVFFDNEIGFRNCAKPSLPYGRTVQTVAILNGIDGADE